MTAVSRMAVMTYLWQPCFSQRNSSPPLPQITQYTYNNNAKSQPAACNNSRTVATTVYWFCMVYVILLWTFSALMLLVGWQEGIQRIKNWVVGCWRSYLPGSRCRFAYGQLMPLQLTVSCSSKSKLVLPFWYQLTRVVLGKRPLNRCVYCKPCAEWLWFIVILLWRTTATSNKAVQILNTCIVYVLPMLMYGSETWTVTKTLARRLNAFDTWSLCKILCIQYTRHVTDATVRETTLPPVSSLIHKRRLHFFRHLAQADSKQGYWRRLWGHPHATWIRRTDADVQSASIRIHSAWKKANDYVLCALVTYHLHSNALSWDMLLTKGKKYIYSNTTHHR